MGRKREIRPPGASYTVTVRGAPIAVFDNAYHGFLRASWPVALAAIIVAFLGSNVLFAFAYQAVGGVEHITDGSWLDAFFFSVQTMGTIGYGGMFPASVAANVVVVAESVYGLLLTALSTGLLFAKFSQPQGRIVFSQFACVTQHDSKPTLMFRIGNERGNRVIEANVRLDASLTTVTAEGRPFYRMTELTPVRSRIPALARSFSVMHVLDESSPLFGLTEAQANAEEIEILVTIIGLDDTTGQATHGQELYEPDRLKFNHRFVDVLTQEDGQLVLDVSRFHDVEPSA